MVILHRTGQAPRRSGQLNSNVRPQIMPPLVFPECPLSQVSFVQDYIQLVFQHETLSIYNPAEVCIFAKRIASGEPGFADALVHLIGRSTMSVQFNVNELLRLEFDDGSTVAVQKAAADSSSIEAFKFNGNNTIVVGQNHCS